MKIQLLLFLILFPCFLFSQDKIVFEKKKNPKRHYEVKRTLLCNITLIDGKKIGGYIYSVKDSIITFRTFNQDKHISTGEAIKIWKDKSLTKLQRQRKYVDQACTDSVMIPFSSIKNCLIWETGFTKKYFLVLGANILYAIGISELDNNINMGSSNNKYGGIFPEVFAGELALAFTIDYFILTKRINPQKWELKK